MLRPLRLVLVLLLGAMACAPDPGVPAQAGGPAADLKGAAAEHYEAYGQALAGAQRSAIATFYHPDGALIVFNGEARRQSRADLQGEYEGAWSPPAYFAWENLAFDLLAPGEVIVTGGFKWQSVGAPDTLRFIYAAVLVARDSGLGIVFEHETLRP